MSSTCSNSSLIPVSPVVPVPLCSPSFSQTFSISISSHDLTFTLTRYSNLVHLLILSSPWKVGSILQVSASTGHQVKFLLGARPSLASQVDQLPDYYALLARQIHELFHEDIVVLVGWKSITLEGVRTLIQAINTHMKEKDMQRGDQESSVEFSTPAALTENIQQLTLSPADII
jgi:hypothetical protein